jgi:acyl carrier protein
LEKLIVELKQNIVKNLNLEDVSWEDIETDAPLFVEGLGLDSIDALELIVMLEMNYGIKIESSETGKKILYSVKTIAETIMANKQDS